MKQKEGRGSKPTWAYAYELVPPQAVDRLAPIKTLLDQEAANAKLKSQTWEARLVRASHVSHILIVCDTPDQGREVNRRIEAELEALQAGFSLTVPMAVVEGAAGPPSADQPALPTPTRPLVPEN